MANRRILIAVAALVAVRIYLHVLMEQEFAVRPYRPGLAYKRFDFNIHRWEDDRGVGVGEADQGMGVLWLLCVLLPLLTIPWNSLKLMI